MRAFIEQIVSIHNRQRVRRIDSPQLRKLTLICLHELLHIQSFEIGIQIVNAAEITRLNEQYLRHQGSTDVITFNYLERTTRRALGRPARFPLPQREGTPALHRLADGGGEGAAANALHGDIFVCIDEAIAQAKRFRTSWQQEIVRYIVHGILHLLGYNDRTAAQRTKMKREENRLMTRLGDA